MLTDQERERFIVVLVRARNSSNIGAAARAMRDFGFAHLRVVNEFLPPVEAARSAVDASEVIENAQVFAGVGEAVADCTLVVGTTAVGERSLRHELLDLPAAGGRIVEALRAVEQQTVTRIALLFGSEKTGLSNEELSHCQWLLTIPMHQIDGEHHVSMNLGQAVAVCLYELVRGVQSAPSGNTALIEDDPADAASLERITVALNRVLEATEYTRRHAANSESAQVRRLVRRIGASAVDAPIWMGILRQILWKLGLQAHEK